MNGYPSVIFILQLYFQLTVHWKFFNTIVSSRALGLVDFQSLLSNQSRGPYTFWNTYALGFQLSAVQLVLLRAIIGTGSSQDSEAVLCSWCSDNCLEQCFEHNSSYVKVVPIFVCSEYCPVIYYLFYQIRLNTESSILFGDQLFERLNSLNYSF